MSINRCLDKEDVVCVCVCVYIYIMEYYSPIKKKETVLSAAIWMQLETITPSEGSQKDKYHMISFTYGI